MIEFAGAAAWRACCLGVVALLAMPAAAWPADHDGGLAEGRSIYLLGKLGDGQPLRGQRPGRAEVSLGEAACVNCHRASGLGGVEGQVSIPPINGRALFGGGDPVVVRMDRPFDPGVSVPHATYTKASFAAVIRGGHTATGRDLDALMPRYALDDTQLESLTEYLRTLSAAWSPGVTSEQIKFATVITPDVDPERRRAFLATLQALVNQVNVNMGSGLRKDIPVVERRLRTRRKWLLEVWELRGPSSDWAAQLERWQANAPVFALLSGLGGTEWQPVQQFCEQHRVGCWFPSIDLAPAGAEQGSYSLYFSRGIALEAAVMASRLSTQRGRVVQLVAADPVSRAAAAALHQSLLAQRSGVAQGLVVEIDWPNSPSEHPASAIAALGEHDALVLWAGGSDLAKLTAMPPPAARVFVSASLSGSESADLPAAWRQRALLVQPLERASLQAANLERFDAWLDASKLPMADRRMQSEVYFSARFLEWTLRGMLNNLQTDYLIERAEASLSVFEAMQVQDEVQAMTMGGGGKRPPSRVADFDQTAALRLARAQRAKVDEMIKRGGTTAYPRLSLGPGQRFASKGAYLEKLEPTSGGDAAEPDWVVP